MCYQQYSRERNEDGVEKVETLRNKGQKAISLRILCVKCWKIKNDVKYIKV